MFESAELRQEVSKEDYEAAVPALREALLDAQYDLLAAKSFPVLVIIGGVEGAGKSETVQTLNEWLDPRHVHTHGFLLPTDEEAQRPPMYRFWRALPPKGETGIFFGSWYSLPMVERVLGDASRADLDRSINEIRHLERMLHNEGVLILKFWFHISERDQRKRLSALEASPATRWRYGKTIARVVERYDEMIETAELVLRETSTGEAPWIVVDGHDHRHRTLAVGKALLDALRRRLDAIGVPHLPNNSHIVPVMVYDPVVCKNISDILLDEHGVYVQPINYPTVPRGTERLRITPSPVHSDADMDHLVAALEAVWSRYSLRRAA
jgi:polyphosphate kinase 2 (PPK2 family)